MKAPNAKILMDTPSIAAGISKEVKNLAPPHGTKLNAGIITETNILALLLKLIIGAGIQSQINHKPALNNNYYNKEMSVLCSNTNLILPLYLKSHKASKDSCLD